jgi:hypothetical protein
MEASRLPDGPYLDELFDILQLRARDGTPYVQITIQCRGIMAQRNQDEVERLEIVAPYFFVRLKKTVPLRPRSAWCQQPVFLGFFEKGRHGVYFCVSCVLTGLFPVHGAWLRFGMITSYRRRALNCRILQVIP